MNSLNISINPYNSGYFQRPSIGLNVGGNHQGQDMQRIQDTMLGLSAGLAAGTTDGRGRKRNKSLSNALKSAFGNNDYGEVQINQKKPKKGQKVPPDVKFKGNLSRLPAILKTARA